MTPGLVKPLGALVALASGGLTDDRGRVLIDLKIGGDVRQPRVSLDPKATSDRVAGRVSSSLREQAKWLERALLGAGGSTPRADTAATDSARAAQRKEVVDQLKKIKGRDLLKALFGGAGDTTKR